MLKYKIKKVSDISDEEYTKCFYSMSEQSRTKVKRFKNTIQKKCTLAGECLARKTLAEVTGENLCAALEQGVAAAYKAVMKPTEGTMLTVMRIASERASALSATETDPLKIWEEVMVGAKDATVKMSAIAEVLIKEASDIQEVNTTYTVNYQISKKNAQDLYRDVGTGYLETVVNPTIQETVKTIIARYTAEELIGKTSNLLHLLDH